jgi:quinol monooxygenase YgiN
MTMTGVFPRSNHVVTVRYTVLPDAVSRMRVITHDLTTASRAENGCVLYHFSESADKEGVFFLTMMWRDEAAYQHYAASDYVRAFTSILSSGMLDKPPVVDKWRSLG